MSRKDRIRRAGTRQQEKRFLVVVEGRVTEREYIGATVPRVHKRNVVIKTSRDTRHTDPVGIVNAAKQLRLEACKTEPFDQTWCVFDVEAKHAGRGCRRLSTAQSMHVVAVLVLQSRIHALKSGLFGTKRSTGLEYSRTMPKPNARGLA